MTSRLSSGYNQPRSRQPVRGRTESKRYAIFDWLQKIRNAARVPQNIFSSIAYNCGFISCCKIVVQRMKSSVPLLSIILAAALITFQLIQVQLSLVCSLDADLHEDSCRLIANEAIFRDLEMELKNRADDKNKDKETRRETEYVPADCEKFIVEHATELGLASKEFPSGCRIWKSKDTLNPDLYHNLTAYATDLEQHSQVVKDFKPIPDLLKSIIETGSHDVCKLARPHPGGIRALFRSDQLSLTRSGYVEPLTSPMRSQKICDDFDKNLMKLDYLVHDFEHMCRNLKPTSKRVLIDMGASLSFHHDSREHDDSQPVVELLDLYAKFGFHFDHIYGFELEFTKPETVFEELLPEKYLAKYHWINTGVSCETNNRMNPLHSIVESFDQDDLIVVKLDIDTPSVELPLAYQILEGGRNGTYHKLIDHFYFEHHVPLEELKAAWGRSNVKGTIKESLELFYFLREKGVAAHFWP